jgi:hypothetical protein
VTGDVGEESLCVARLWRVGSQPHNQPVGTNDDGASVDHADLDYDGELIFTYEGQPFSGVAYEDVPGKWYSEVTYRAGMQEGPARDWYPSGSLKGESYHHENALHGISREFDETGRLRSEEI